MVQTAPHLHTRAYIHTHIYIYAYIILQTPHHPNHPRTYIHTSSTSPSMSRWRKRPSKETQAWERTSEGILSEMVAESGKIRGRKERECGQMGVRRRAWMPVFGGFVWCWWWLVGCWCWCWCWWWWWWDVFILRITNNNNYNIYIIYNIKMISWFRTWVDHAPAC